MLMTPLCPRRGRGANVRSRAGRRQQDPPWDSATRPGAALLRSQADRALRRTTRERLRHFLSAAGLRLEDIADIVGHASIRMTAEVYRHHVEPTITAGKAAMDAIFGNEPEKFGGQFGGQGQLFGS